MKELTFAEIEEVSGAWGWPHFHWPHWVQYAASAAIGNAAKVAATAAAEGAISGVWGGPAGVLVGGAVGAGVGVYLATHKWW